ncbi:hypothetical protein [Exiguobacterium undae]|uniref:Apea-like HEPN domain-containing protein n=1 Tax=Exiguobacterium undae TaxID=169177 RepID=A0ABX2V8U6_9BACL|nr:hypothetical protein [Exiguobacterium undae]OAN14627.1 hypothetical protein A3783_01475 [Exiguobacterium undae]
MDPFKIDVPGLKTRLTDQGFFEMIMSPDELPFENGIAFYEIKMEFKNAELKSKQNASTYCVGKALFDHPFSLNSGGDSNIKMDNNEQLELEINQRIFQVNLLKNKDSRLGSMEINTNDFDEMSFIDAQNTMFHALNYVTNKLSLTFETPLRISSFFILFDLNVFSIIEARYKIKHFNKLDLQTGKIRVEKLDNARSFYNKGLAAQDPQIKFLNLYLACEMIRSLIKSHFGQKEQAKRIKGKDYKEPLIKNKHNHNITNANEQNKLIDKEYSYVLYVEYRKLRNSAAHHLLDDGSFKSTTNLKDYKDYYLAVPYLIEIFEGYLSELLERL